MSLIGRRGITSGLWRYPSAGKVQLRALMSLTNQTSPSGQQTVTAASEWITVEFR